VPVNCLLSTIRVLSLVLYVHVFSYQFLDITSGTSVDDIIRGGTTANLCSTDLSKAFNKVYHHALYLKLMERFIPNKCKNPSVL